MERKRAAHRGPVARLAGQSARVVRGRATVGAGGLACAGAGAAGRLAHTLFLREDTPRTGQLTSDQEFNLTAEAFENPDWPAVTLHSYLHRWGHAPGDPAYEHDEARLRPAPQLAVPTLVLHGAADGVNEPQSSQGRQGYFTGRYERQLLDGVGHFPPREAPDTVAAALLRFLQQVC